MNVAVLLLTLSVALPVHGTHPKLHKAKDPIPGSYIVVLRDDVPDRHAVALDMALRHGGLVRRVYNVVLNGFAVDLTEREAEKLADDPRVDYIEENGMTFIDTEWNLDRVDQRYLPLDGNWFHAGSASNVHAYVLDTGIEAEHQEFGGRVELGVDFVQMTGYGTSDPNGHGTHVAGTIGGATFGIVRDIRLVPVRIANENGVGGLDPMIAGLDFVAAHAIKPAVANMSAHYGTVSSALNTAADNVVNSGVVLVVSAGNQGNPQYQPGDACNYSPQSASKPIVVSATDSADRRPPWANIGDCVDIFAPGVEIRSATRLGGYATLSGTSQAAPHVTGAAALLFRCGGTVIGNSTIMVVYDAGTGSSNRLLYVKSCSAAASLQDSGGLASYDAALFLSGIFIFGLIRPRTRV